jgi:hypothetical protein
VHKAALAPGGMVEREDSPIFGCGWPAPAMTHSSVTSMQGLKIRTEQKNLKVVDFIGLKKIETISKIRPKCV